MSILNQLKEFKKEFEFIFKYQEKNISAFMVFGLSSTRNEGFKEFLSEFLREVVSERRYATNNVSFGISRVKSMPGANIGSQDSLQELIEERKDV